ncbi:MAG: serine/threonine-protein kinase [Solirubrobacterales bacterium]
MKHDERCSSDRRQRSHRRPSSIAACAQRLRRHIAAGSGDAFGRRVGRNGGLAADHIAVRSHYELGELLGAGGLGEVFRATRLGAEGFRRTVAIKRIRPELAQQERFVQMFIREAQVLCRLMHPNVVSVCGFERDRNGQLFLEMEYVAGVDLDKLLDSGPLPHGVIIFIVAEILSGLGHAHHFPQSGGALGVVHRDLSPHNVLLSWDAAVKVADFGLAKLRRSTHVSASLDLQGKVAFMSPEQAACRPLDIRSDLFSVGVMLWEMLTGERLFAREHEDIGITRWRVLMMDWIVRPSAIRPVAPDLEAVVMRLLEREPAQRYPTAEAAQVALLRCTDVSKVARFELERILASRFPQAPARPLSPGPTFAPEPRGRTQTEPPLGVQRPRRRWAVLAVVVGCMLVAVSIGALAGVVARRMSSLRCPGMTMPTTLCTAAAATCGNLNGGPR